MFSNIFNQNKQLFILLSLLCIASIIALFRLAPIPQDLAYHDFADQISRFGINNFANTCSNLGFILMGGFGLYRHFQHKLALPADFNLIVKLFFLALILVGLGSAYYHLIPNNQTLLWDRLPMTIAFMAFFCLVIGEFVSSKLANYLLLPLCLLGLSSVLYWYATEYYGRGDLRFYIWVQFYPMMAIAIILLFAKWRGQVVAGFWTVLVCYLFAKLFEHFDLLIYQQTGFISGHSLKHLIPVLGIYLLIKRYQSLAPSD